MSVEQLLCARMVGVFSTSPPPALPNLIAGGVEYRAIHCIVPQNEIIDDAEKSLALLIGQNVLEGWGRTWFWNRQSGSARLFCESLRFLPQLETSFERAFS